MHGLKLYSALNSIHTFFSTANDEEATLDPVAVWFL